MENETMYGMGVDEGGYDGNTYGIAVYKKDFGFVYVNAFRDESDYRKEVERVAILYNIKLNQILKEVNQ